MARCLKGGQPSCVTPRHPVSDDLPFERDYQFGRRVLLCSCSLGRSAESSQCKWLGVISSCGTDPCCTGLLEKYLLVNRSGGCGDG